MSNWRKLSLDHDEVDISFDITSLYTNVPVKEAIFGDADKLYSGKLVMPPSDKETFIIFAELVTTNVVMLNHDGSCCQIDGLAMGSQPTLPLSNRWLSKYEPNIWDDAKQFGSYIDGIARTIKKFLIQTKLNGINGLHPNSKFTLEVEAEGKIPFPDLCINPDLYINHANDKLSSTWYCKPNDTEIIMNYHALAPKLYKRSFLEVFVHRDYRACNSWEKIAWGHGKS